ISSYGLIIYCTPAVLNAVLLSVNVILDVVSGTLLKHTSIFIGVFFISLHPNLPISKTKNKRYTEVRRQQTVIFLCKHSIVLRDTLRWKFPIFAFVMENRLEELQRFLNESPEDPFLKYALTMEWKKRGDAEKTFAGFQDLRLNHPD